MPFTLAHPAVVPLLARVMGSQGVLSALVIGSMAPDFVYLLPSGISRAHTHSLAGVLWFCVPAGLGAYWLFHSLMKQPLLALTPEGLHGRLDVLPAAQPGLPQVSFVQIVMSLVIGTFSHIAWDAFTHSGAPAVEAFPVLQTVVLQTYGHELRIFKILQHGSTAVGFLLLGCWFWRWYQQADTNSVSVAHGLSPRNQAAALIGIIGATVVFMFSIGALQVPPDFSFESVRLVVGRIVIAGMRGLLFSVVGFSVW